MRGWIGFEWWLASGLVAWGATPAEGPAPGLVTVFTSMSNAPAAAMDVGLSAGIRLYVPAGESPSPFLPEGPFKAEWTGHISVDLRSDMFFEVEAGGRFMLEINGAPVLEHEGRGGSLKTSKPVRLNKGPNALRAVLTSPREGDTWVRLGWGEEEGLLMPVAFKALGHSAGLETPELGDSRRRLLGRELALEHRCFKCHAATLAHPVPELAMDAPSFEGIGARRRPAWMARWIENPKSVRPSARMPSVAHGAAARKDAEAMAAFLATLTNHGEVVIPEPAPHVVLVAGSAEPNEAVQGAAPANLYEALHCQACHGAAVQAEPEPGLIALRLAGQKFADGKLAEYLRQPEAHYGWTGMPNFRLTSKEAEELARFILAAAPVPPSESGPAGGAEASRGRDLVQSAGCLSCHRLELENRHRAPAFLSLKRWDAGCLADAPGPEGRAPAFGFLSEEREALRAFVRSGAASLGRHVPGEFAERQTRLLQCAGCHGRFDGFPPLEILGEKLKPEWMERFLSGSLPERPRPWLYSRMPMFQERARLLALGLSMGQGFAPRSAAEPPGRPELAEAGRRLVGKEGGFSCVSCHGVGSQKAMEVFEAEGNNFSHVAERLQPSYYRRWLLNPILIDPRSKMPMYFDRGASPLTEILDGDAARQIEAMWEYFRSLIIQGPPGGGPRPGDQPTTHPP